MHELQNVLFDNFSKIFKLPTGKKLIGIALAKVLCPRNISYPFLMYRSEKTGKNSLPICRVCADMENTTKCTHEERYIYF